MPFSKKLGMLPKMANKKIEITADIEFFRFCLSGDLEDNSGKSYTTLPALNIALKNAFEKIVWRQKAYVLFDELEVFFESQEIYDRDRRFVRDLLWAIDHLNSLAKLSKSKLYLIGAVRSEVLSALGNLSQEVQRTVTGRGQSLSWTTTRRSITHPILLMISNKIHKSITGRVSDNLDENLVYKYFPKTVGGVNIDIYLLDRSFYKPRDLINRIEAAKSVYPDSCDFNERVLQGSEKAYSSTMLEELKLELSAYYSDEQVNSIVLMFSGRRPYFNLNNLKERVEVLRRFSGSISLFDVDDNLITLLNRMFRLGAVGNEFSPHARSGKATPKINNWVHRGDQTLLIQKQMVLNRSLWKALTTS